MDYCADFAAYFAMAWTKTLADIRCVAARAGPVKTSIAPHFPLGFGAHFAEQAAR